MGLTTPKVYRWPAEAEQLVAEPALLIATVHTPKTAKREFARQRVREALVEILAGRLNCPVHVFRLTAAPGEPPRLAAPYQEIGISFSHDAGCSIIAINLSGPIGIDLLQLDDKPSWENETLSLAADYLGPEISAQLHSLTGQKQISEFAQAWVAHEARLKALGLPLSEWSAALEKQLENCLVYRLNLPAPMYAAVATGSRQDRLQTAHAKPLEQLTGFTDR